MPRRKVGRIVIGLSVYLKPDVNHEASREDLKRYVKDVLSHYAFS
jgi:hypothetical protein